MTAMKWRRGFVCIYGMIFVTLLGACAPGPEDFIDDLSGSQDEREAAAQELLLAKEKAVGPLLAALADPEKGQAQAALVEILVSLMMRVEDARIATALTGLLDGGSDADLKARIIRLVGMHRRTQLLDAVIKGLSDPEARVRLQALIAIDSFAGKMHPEQEVEIDLMARKLLTDESLPVRREAMIRVASQVDALLDKANQAALAARLAEAESLFVAALEIDPSSQRAHYRLARFMYDNDSAERGIDSLRAHGLLLDVPLLPQAPALDGRLDEAAWSHAARADGAYQFSFSHTAATPSDHASHFFIGRTARSLWIGFYGEDADPQDLVAKVTPDMQDEADSYEGGPVGDASIWTDDIIELFIDTNFDHSSYAHIGINSLGVTVDEWIARSRQEAFESGDFSADFSDEAWRANDALAVNVGADHWSIEYRIDFDDSNIPAPAPGTIWGFNLIRVYRGEEYNQWVRTYSGGHSPDDFGVLLFQ